jgi:hypothetical protein
VSINGTSSTMSITSVTSPIGRVVSTVFVWPTCSEIDASEVLEPNFYHLRLSPIVTLASGVPMDILVPDGSQRIPQLQRNAGGRVLKNASELNAFITQVNVGGGFAELPLPLVSDNARFNDSFSSLDLRLSKQFQLNDRVSIEAIGEVFNLFNVTNVLGVSNVNYSGFGNVLVRDSNDQSNPGFLRSSSFGQPVTTAGGVFGSGGPRAFQLAARILF